jgi:uncharacterized protein (TIGR03084 family)
MIQQAIDFRDESEALYQLIAPVTIDMYRQPTQFKGWTINDVLGHLHMWNWAADLSLNDNAAFEKFFTSLVEALTSGTSLRQFEKKWRDGLEDQALLAAWRGFVIEMSDRFAAADPKRRVKWAGPDMSVRSSITARLMETWAHGQEVYDLLGVVRRNTDRIENIALLGVNTFGWAFTNRGLPVPERKPYVRLTAPSGKIWEWNDPTSDDRVEGLAEEFCQVVTQVRHLDDTSLTVCGEVAGQWMAIAQCFAGPPHDPPAPGSRFTQ